MRKLLTVLLALTMGFASAATKAEITSLQGELTELIAKAQAQGINTLKEETSLRTSELFLVYIDWDKANIAKNTEIFSKTRAYKAEAARYAKELPEYELSELKALLTDNIAELKSVMAGEIRRLDTPKVDWRECTVEGDQITFEGKPVFLADWTWKPKSEKYTEFHGNLGIQSLSFGTMINAKGDIAPKTLEDIAERGDKSLGFIFVNNAMIPKWALNSYPDIKEGAGIKYTMYDIHNPGAKQMMSDLLAGTVPTLKGRKGIELGYMLCNEPHWNIIDKEWAASPLSDYAIADFRKWLEQRHGDIKSLNAAWKSKAKSFDELKLPKILQRTDIGSGLWHDMMLFNMERTTAWFKFMRDEIKKHDPNAPTMVKLIPHQWSSNGRVHGIDIEQITRDSDIHGNDASTGGKAMWGEAEDWENRYTFNWFDVGMDYDLMKSVNPNKINFNSEGHFLSRVKFRDLYMTEQYVRCNFYLAHIQGMTASQNWYWARQEDGSTKSDGPDYAGTNNQQPRVVNAVHTTMLELNAVSDIIMAYQRESKNVRLYMSNAGAIISDKYMTDIKHAYEDLFFEGMSIGFATSRMAENEGTDLWKVVQVVNTPNVYKEDITALQDYLDKGGIVVMDEKSLLMDEYGRKIEAKLKSGKGQLIMVKSAKEAAAKTLEIASKLKLRAPIQLTEKNKAGAKGCVWRVVEAKDGGYNLFVTNIGKSKATINITMLDGKAPKSVEDIATGKKYGGELTLEPTDLLLVKIN
ncbi:MAG: beta-galactosidase [Rikenellaceae bacterium]